MCVSLIALHMTEDRKRGEGGEYVEEFAADTVLEAFERAERPFLSSQEVAERLGCSQRTALRKLGKLDDQNGDGTLKRVDFGERQAVWWLPESNAE